MEMEKDYDEMIVNEETESVLCIKFYECFVILHKHKHEDDYFSEYDCGTGSSYLEAKGIDEGVKIFIKTVEYMFDEVNDYILYKENGYTDERKVEISKEYAQDILEWLEYLQREHDDYAEYIEKHSRKLTAYLTELISD